MPIDPLMAFVSYSREDLEFASRLAKDLKAKDAKVWMDKLDIRPGQRWEIEVQRALDGCLRMLVILSPASIASSNVLAEAGFAIDEGKEVIPVLYRDCKIPFRLRPYQYADFRSDYSIGLEELLVSLNATQMATPNPASPEENAGLTPQESAGQPAMSAKGRHEEAERNRLAAEQTRPEQATKQAEAGQVHMKQEERQPEAAEDSARRAEPDHQRVVAEAEREPAQRSNAAPEESRPETGNGQSVSRQNGRREETYSLPANMDPGLADSYHRALSGDSKAMVTLATAYANATGTGGDYRQAFFWFRKAADAGDGSGMRGLGYMYFSGCGVEKDYKQAIVWFRSAAEAGDTNAMCNLGVIYRDGLGETKDYSQAVSWYRKAANARNPRGMTGLAFMYLKGYGVAEDYRAAVEWYRRAADLRDQDATDALERLGESL